jgi:hypothetical protein
LASGRSISLEARAAGLYRFCQTLIAECDQELAKLLRAFPDRSAGVALAEETRKGRRKKKRGNSPQFDLRQLLYLMSGVDLARIDGIDVITAMTVVPKRQPHEPLANGRPFCFLAAACAGQPHQWR